MIHSRAALETASEGNGEETGPYAQAVAAVRAKCGLVPRVGIILGTGLGALADDLEVEAAIPYAEVDGLPVPTVESHAGRLSLGRLEGTAVAIMQGRFHRYEGYSLQEVTFPVRLMPSVHQETPRPPPVGVVAIRIAPWASATARRDRDPSGKRS